MEWINRRPTRRSMAYGKHIYNCNEVNTPKTLHDVLIKYLSTSLGITAWSLTLLLGGIFLLIYYANEKYFPVLDFNSSMTLLAAIALTGGYVFLYLGFLLVAPGAIWNTHIKSNSHVRTFLERLSKRKLIIRHLLWLVLPSSGTIVAFYIFYRFGTDVYRATLGAFFVIASLCVIITSVIRDFRLPAAAIIEIIFLLTFSSLMVASMSMLTLWIILYLSNSTSEYTTIFVLFFVIAMNVFAMMMQDLKWISLLSVITLFVVLMYLHKVSLISEKVIALYKLGNFDAKLVLTHQGCEAMAGMGFKTHPLTTNHCHTDTIKIISRIGKEYYLKSIPDNIYNKSKTDRHSNRKKPTQSDIYAIIPSNFVQMVVIQSSKKNNTSHQKIKQKK